MAHRAQHHFFELVKEAYPDKFIWSNVCEIGSLDINGSIRGLFEYANYVGFDVAPGPAVDYAVYGEDVYYPDNSFDITVSSECFEHAETWREIFGNMKRMTKRGGLVVFTCAGTGRPEHGTSRSDVGSSPLTVAAGIEYYGNLTPADFKEEDLQGLDYQFYENTVSCDLYFVGRKGAKLNRIDLEAVDWSKQV